MGRGIGARLLLDFSYFGVATIERGGELLVDDCGIVAFDEVGCVAVSLELREQFFVGGTRHYRGPGNFVAVQMEDGQYGSIARRIQEFDAFPTSFEWAGFRFAIADDAGDDQVWIIERGAERVQQRIAQLATFVHGIGRMRAAVAGNSAGRGEGTEEQ